MCHSCSTTARRAAGCSIAAGWLGFDRFYVLGHSGGGAHALACAALLPERVIAAATVAGAAPHDAEGLDWLAGQEEENIDEWQAALAGGERLRKLLKTGPRRITPETAAFAAERRKHTLSSGIWGWFDDDIAETKPWGFELEQIAVPVSVWHGGQDRFVPPAHGDWLVNAIPGAQAHFRSDEGHFSLVDAKFHELVEDLLANSR